MRYSILLLIGLMIAPSTVTTHSFRAAVLTVTNANDSGAGSLRQAIIDANSMAGTDTIEFNIPGPGRHTIDLLSALPALTEAATIDGGTQPGFSTNSGANPLIELNGFAVPAPDAVLTLSGATASVVALSLTRGQDAGIRITTGAGVHLDWCAIGTITRNSFLQKDIPGTGNAGPGVDVVGGTGLLVERTRVAFNGASGIVVRSGASGVHTSQVELYSNTGPEFDLNGDGRTPNDVGDGDTGGNTLLNFPILERVEFTSAGKSIRRAIFYGRLEAAPLTNYRIRLFFGRIGETGDELEVTETSQGGGGLFMTDASGFASFNFGVSSVPPGSTAVAGATMDMVDNTSEFSIPLVFPDLVADSGCGACGVEWLIIPALAALWRRRPSRIRRT